MNGSLQTEGASLRAASGASVVALATVTAILGLWGLSHQGLWPDEAFSFHASEFDVSTLLRVVRIDEAYSAFYYALLHVWRQAGTSEAWLRFPSVIFGVAAVVTLFALNHRLFGKAIATMSCVLLITNVFFVRYMQEVRVYTLALLLVVVASYCFVAALDRPTARRWVVYGVVSAVAIYAHVFSGFVIAAHVLSLALRRNRPPIHLVLGGPLVTALLVSPLALVMVSTEGRTQAVGQTPSLDSIKAVFLYLTGGAGIPSRGTHLLLLVYFALCGMALLVMLRTCLDRRDRQPDGAWSSVLVLLWLAVPVLSGFVVSSVYAVFYPRYLIVALPALVTIAAIGISSVPYLAPRIVAVAAVVALSGPQLHSYYRTPIKEGGDWRAAAAYVARHKQPGDRLVVMSRYGRWSIEYHLTRLDALEGLVPLYPSQSWGAFRPVLEDRPAEPTTIAARALVDVHRVWVVLLWGGFDSRAEDAGPVRAVLETRFTQVAGQSFGPSLEARLYQQGR